MGFPRKDHRGQILQLVRFRQFLHFLRDNGILPDGSYHVRKNRTVIVEAIAKRVLEINRQAEPSAVIRASANFVDAAIAQEWEDVA